MRRIRGAIGMGLTWAVAWGAVGGVPRWLFGVNTDAPLPIIFSVFGFIAGVTFFGILTLTHGSRRFDQLSIPRFAGWGAAGGLLLAAVVARLTHLGWGETLAIAPTFGLACAISASGSLALARRAVGQELPGSRRHAAEAELAERETRKLV